MKRTVLLLFAVCLLGTLQARGSFMPFQSAIEIGGSVQPVGEMAVSFLENGQFKTYNIKGKVTRHIFLLPFERPRHDVFKEALNLMSQDNFVTMFAHDPEGADQERIEIGEEYFFREFDEGRMLFAEDRRIYTISYDPNRAGGYYASALRHELDKDTYAVVTISNARNFMQVDVVEVVHRVVPVVETKVKITEEISARGGQVEVIETMVMTKERIKLEIDTHGHINIYGIEFAIDSAEINAKSKATLDAIGQYLEFFPEGSFYVVGHTSDTGALDLNMKLSVSRAQAVIDLLVKDYGIAPERLVGFGVGPVGFKLYTSKGRAHNRRVVLIKRLQQP